MSYILLYHTSGGQHGSRQIQADDIIELDGRPYVFNGADLRYSNEETVLAAKNAILAKSAQMADARVARDGLCGNSSLQKTYDRCIEEMAADLAALERSVPMAIDIRLQLQLGKIVQNDHGTFVLLAAPPLSASCARFAALPGRSSRSASVNTSTAATLAGCTL